MIEDKIEQIGLTVIIIIMLILIMVMQKRNDDYELEIKYLRNINSTYKDIISKDNSADSLKSNK